MSTQQGFPNITVPVMTDQGYVAQPWYQFFIALWNRTGGSGGDVIGGAIPPGMVQPFAGPDTPSGWLYCDGTAVGRLTYPALFSAIGVTWGVGNGTTTFNLPDLRNRFPVGAGGLYTLGQTGGADSATITVANLPAYSLTVTDPGHTHVFTGTPHTHTVTDPQHTHTITDPGHVHASVVAASTNTAGAVAGAVTAGNTASATTGITVDPASTGITLVATTAGGTNASNTTGLTVDSGGSGTAVATLPPYAGLRYLIRT